jgi:hypothetical protein
VEYPSREIWLSEAEAWIPSDGLKIYTGWHLSLLELPPLSFRLRFTPFWLVPNTV